MKPLLAGLAVGLSGIALVIPAASQAARPPAGVVESSTVASTAAPTQPPTTAAPTTAAPTTRPATTLPPTTRPATTLPPTTRPTTTRPPVTVPPTTNPLAVPANSGTGRRIVYSNSRMRIWAIDGNGKVVKTHRVSGKRNMPYSGTYRVYSRSLYTNSVQDPSIKWMYMVRFAYTPRGGRIGFHEIPKKCDSRGVCRLMQTEAQLGQALSGGCVRQARSDAIWVWNWAGIGTKVVVVP